MAIFNNLFFRVSFSALIGADREVYVFSTEEIHSKIYINLTIKLEAV